jgi:hypothetical protein
MDGAIVHEPTLAEPVLVSPGEEMEQEYHLPSPPAPPNAASKAAPKTRSALKKVDGQPAVYYDRPIR